MNMKSGLFVILLLLTDIIYSQSTEIGTRIKIDSTQIIIKTVKVSNCITDTALPGNVIKGERSKTNGSETVTVIRTETATTRTPIKSDKTIKIEMTDFDGYATLSTDDKDKSILHVNYFLNDFPTIDSKTWVKIRERTLNCDTTYSEKIKKYKLKEDSIVNLWIVKCTDFNLKKDWIKHTNMIIEVYEKEDSTKIDYYLVDKYDGEADYTIELKNREFKSYRKYSMQFGAITIPFKYRFPFTKNGISVKEDFSTTLNIGFFGGFKLSNYNVRYEAPDLKDVSNVSLTLGAFVNLGSVTLDSVATNATDRKFTKNQTATIGTLAGGIGFMLNVYSVNFGAFLGWDLGFGNATKSWNYNGRPWLGFGIGYNISGFWQK